MLHLTAPDYSHCFLKPFGLRGDVFVVAMARSFDLMPSIVHFLQLFTPVQISVVVLGSRMHPQLAG